MKNLIFLLITVFAFSFLNAQDISFGLKAGPNFADLNFSDSGGEEFETRTAFHVGGVVELSFSDKFSVQPELLFSSVGAKIEESEGEASMKVQFIENYLSVPIMLKFYPIEGLSLQAGPQIGFLLSAKSKWEISGAGSGEDGTEEEDMKDEFESIDFGVGFGVGYKMDMGLFFDARYVLGMINVVKEIDDDEYVKNNVIQLSVGYMFK